MMIVIHEYLLIEFILIFFRVISMIVIMPFIGSSAVPAWGKIGLAFFMSLIIYPLVIKTQVIPHVALSMLALYIISQILIGFIFGFLVLIIFTGVEIAGQLISIQIGFGMINLLNPLVSNQRVSLISNMQNFLALMILIETSAFFFIIEGLYRSFQTIPLTFVSFSPFIFQYLVQKGGEMFLIGFDLSIPIIIVTVLLNVIIALMGRLAPQFNIFAVGFPITIAVGLLILYISTPYFTNYVINSFSNLKIEFIHLINSLSLIS
ncbi:flagellar biosynthetic protein FliR [Candidatus Acidulodesulfobacterium sp. H_13]|uniref:flagellar biosynthetic protein FliR n=1 Tax=Candidatus Acidulodesulfobacterium sp. H_13 TaxID=3395470 RepID=UPI003AF95B0B